MTLWAVIPAKSLAEGKSRLAGALAPPARAELVATLLRRAIAAAAPIAGLSRTIVVSADRGVADLATAAGATWIAEPANLEATAGLNGALEHAARVVRERGGTRVLSLAADLPLVEPEDIAAMVERARDDRGVVAAPDRAGTGTNAVLVWPPVLIAYCFGPGSFRAFGDAAAKAGLPFSAVRRPGLEFDIDTPEDLADFKALGAAGRENQGLVFP